jgi:hypothetical protein
MLKRDLLDNNELATVVLNDGCNLFGNQIRMVIKHIVLLLLLTSCMKTDIINEVEPQLDTVVMQKPHRPLPPPIEEDTTRVQIGFNPTVQDWDNAEIEM